MRINNLPAVIRSNSASVKLSLPEASVPKSISRDSEFGRSVTVLVPPSKLAVELIAISSDRIVRPPVPFTVDEALS